ncbi:GCK domain protein, partial [Trifolium medium]|nr:GCK domain protein [Trifolium medium]
NQPEKLQSDAKPEDPSPDQPDKEEEEGECGFCLFMKEGGCKDTFIDWENCVKEAEDKKEDIVEKCSQVTARLMQCMYSHSNYYGKIPMPEMHAEEQAVIELEKEKQDSSANAPYEPNQK